MNSTWHRNIFRCFNDAKLYQQCRAQEKNAFCSVSCPEQQLERWRQREEDQSDAVTQPCFPHRLSQLQRFVTRSQAQGNLCLTVSWETFPPTTSQHFFNTRKLFLAPTSHGNDSPGLALQLIKVKCRRSIFTRYWVQGFEIISDIKSCLKYPQILEYSVPHLF